MKIVISTVVMVGVAMSIICLFSDMFGTGESIIDHLLEFGARSWTVFFVVVAYATFMYLLDVSYWSGLAGQVFRRLTLLGLAAGMCVLAISLIREEPYMPLTVFIFLLPTAALAIRFTGLRNNNAAGVAWVLGTSFLVAAVVCLLLWVLWLYGSWDDDNQGWQDNRQYFSDLAKCNNTNDEHGEDKEVAGRTVVDGIVICTAAFLLWVSPFVLFGVLVFLGSFLILMSRMLASGNKKSSEQLLRVFGIAIFSAFFGMYSASSVGGAEMGLSNVALAIYASILVCIVVVAGATLGWGELQEKMRERTKKQKLGATTLNFMHAFAICFGTIPFVIFVALSVLNQAARKMATSVGVLGVCKPLADEEREQMVTTVAKRRLALMANWDWGKALTYSYYLCAAVWVMKVFSNFTYIFFNWLTTILRDLDFGLVTVIFIVIGLLMFLIPVVPGPAVYLTAGVLMVPLGKQKFGSGAGFDPCREAEVGSGGEGGPPEDNDLTAFGLSCAYACTLSFALKLIAHVLQQKAIGETFSSRVAVRAMVGPNTQQMRAARYILEERGLTIAKASLLCGGPDWPTSVICGLLKLNCCQMLIGLTPIVFFTTPGTLLGAFMTEKAMTDLSLDVVCMLVVLLVQLLMGVVFFSHCYRVIATKADALAAFPTDEAVAELDAKNAQFEAVVAEVGDFRLAPPFVRYLFVSGMALSVLSAYALVLTGSTLFQAFSITDCIETLGRAPPGAAWYENFVIPMLGIKVLGFVMILFILYGLFALKYFQRWQTRQAERRIADGAHDAASPASAL